MGGGERGVGLGCKRGREGGPAAQQHRGARRGGVLGCAGHVTPARFFFAHGLLSGRGPQSLQAGTHIGCSRHARPASPPAPLPHARSRARSGPGRTCCDAALAIASSSGPAMPFFGLPPFLAPNGTCMPAMVHAVAGGSTVTGACGARCKVENG